MSWVKVVVAQMCLTLCDPVNYSLPSSSVHGVLQARILPFPSPGDLPDPGIKPWVPCIAGRFFYHLSHQGSPVMGGGAACIDRPGNKSGSLGCAGGGECPCRQHKKGAGGLKKSDGGGGVGHCVLVAT